MLSPDPERRPTAEQIFQLPTCQRTLKVRKSGKSFVLAMASALFGTFRTVFATSIFASAFKTSSSPPSSPRLIQGGLSPSTSTPASPTLFHLSPESSAPLCEWFFLFFFSFLLSFSFGPFFARADFSCSFLPLQPLFPQKSPSSLPLEFLTGRIPLRLAMPFLRTWRTRPRQIPDSRK